MDDIQKESSEEIELKNSMKCRQCDNMIETLFLPCRHIVTCETCADKLDHCIRCHGIILGTVKVYFN